MKRIIVIFTLIIAATLISHAQMKPDKLPPLITDAIAGPPMMLQVGAGVAAGGETPSITYVNRNSASGTSVGLNGVSAGNLIVVLLQWQDSANEATVSDGSSTFSYTTTVANGDERIRFAYTTSSTASGNVTYTMTQSGGVYPTVGVFEIEYTGTCTLDHSGSGATGSGETATSANGSSSESVMVGFGAAGWYDAGTAYDSATLDGVAVDQYTEATAAYARAILTMRIMNNPGTYNSAITATGMSAGDTWAADLIGFKVN